MYEFSRKIFPEISRTRKKFFRILIFERKSFFGFCFLAGKVFPDFNFQMKKFFRILILTVKVFTDFYSRSCVDMDAEA